jgi:hypothetical protein
MHRASRLLRKGTLLQSSAYWHGIDVKLPMPPREVWRKGLMKTTMGAVILENNSASDTCGLRTREVPSICLSSVTDIFIGN